MSILVMNMILYQKKFGEHYKVMASYAYYVGDDNAPGGFKNDTQKIWVGGGIEF